NLEDFDVSTIVQEVAAAVGPIATKNKNTVRVECQPAILHGDRARIRQCFLNLVGNACKFTHDGIVLIDARVASDQGNPESWYQLQVTDTGIGIAPEDMV